MSAKIDFNELQIGVSGPDGWRPVEWHTLTINSDTETITIVPVEGEAIVMPYTSNDLTAEVP